MSEFCPICLLRVNDWQREHGKTTLLNNVIRVHNSCLVDLELRHGKLNIAETVQLLEEGHGTH